MHPRLAGDSCTMQMLYDFGLHITQPEMLLA